MLRVAFAVALAVALVGAALPVIDDARRTNAAATVQGDLQTVERAAQSLLETDEHTPSAGARRSVTVRLPSRSWTNAGIEYVSIGGPPDGPSAGPGRGVVFYRVRGGEPRRLTFDVPLYAPGTPVVLRGDGEHRLVLGVERVDGQRVVTVRLADPAV
jgi:hypothetical protein